MRRDVFEILFFLSYAQPFAILALLAFSSSLSFSFHFTPTIFSHFFPLSFCFLLTFETGSVPFPPFHFVLVFLLSFSPSSSFNFCIFIFSLVATVFVVCSFFLNFYLLSRFMNFYFLLLFFLLFCFRHFDRVFLPSLSRLYIIALFVFHILFVLNTVEFLSASVSRVSFHYILFSILLFLYLIFFFLFFFFFLLYLILFFRSHSLLQMHSFIFFYFFHFGWYIFLNIIPIFISLNLYTFCFIIPFSSITISSYL